MPPSPCWSCGLLAIIGFVARGQPPASAHAMTSHVRGFVPHPSRLNQDWSAVWLAP